MTILITLQVDIRCERLQQLLLGRLGAPSDGRSCHVLRFISVSSNALEVSHCTAWLSGTLYWTALGASALVVVLCSRALLANAHSETGMANFSALQLESDHMPATVLVLTPTRRTYRILRLGCSLTTLPEPCTC